MMSILEIHMLSLTKTIVINFKLTSTCHDEVRGEPRGQCRGPGASGVTRPCLLHNNASVSKRVVGRGKDGT